MQYSPDLIRISTELAVDPHMFSLYLIHYYPVMFLDRYIFDFSTLRPLSLLGAVCAYAVVLLCAYIAWQLIEVRLTKLLRRRLYRL